MPSNTVGCGSRAWGSMTGSGPAAGAPAPAPAPPAGGGCGGGALPAPIIRM